MQLGVLSYAFRGDGVSRLVRGAHMLQGCVCVSESVVLTLHILSVPAQVTMENSISYLLFNHASWFQKHTERDD